MRATTYVVAALAGAALLLGAPSAHASDQLDALAQKVATLEKKLDKARERQTQEDNLAQAERAAASRAATEEQSAVSALAEARASYAGTTAGLEGSASRKAQDQENVDKAQTALDEANSSLTSAQEAVDSAQSKAVSLERKVVAAKNALDYAQSDYDRRSTELANAEAALRQARSVLNNSAASQTSYNQALIARDKAQNKLLESENYLRSSRTAYATVETPWLEADQASKEAQSELETAIRAQASAQRDYDSAAARLADTQITDSEASSASASAKAQLASLEKASKAATKERERAEKAVQEHAQNAAQAAADVRELSSELASVTSQYQQLASAEKSQADLQAAQAAAQAAADAAEEAAGVSEVNYDYVLPENAVASEAQYENSSVNALPLALAGVVILGLAGAMIWRSRQRREAGE